MIFFYILILNKNNFNMKFKPETPTTHWNDACTLMSKDTNSFDSDLSNVSNNPTLILKESNVPNQEFINNYNKSPKKKRKKIKENMKEEKNYLNNKINKPIRKWADELPDEEVKEIEDKIYSLEMLINILPDVSSSDEEEDEELSELFPELEEEIKEKSNFAKKVDKATSFLHRNLIAYSIGGGKRKLEKHISAFIKFVK